MKTNSITFLAFCAYASTAALAAPQAGLPPYGSTAWTVHSCKITQPLCIVEISARRIGSRCQIHIADFIEFDRRHIKKIRWVLKGNSPGFEFELGSSAQSREGITMSLGLTDLTKDTTSTTSYTMVNHALTGQVPRLLTYDINVYWRPQNGTFQPCDAVGPAIINRG